MPEHDEHRCDGGRGDRWGIVRPPGAGTRRGRAGRTTIAAGVEEPQGERSGRPRGARRSLLRSRVPWPLVVALRYLRSARRDAFVSFLSVVAAGGIGLGVAALVLSLAALAGFQRALVDEVLARTPELEVELPPGTDASAVAAALGREPGVEAARAVVRGRGWVVVGGRVRRVRLVGFEGTLPPSFPAARERSPGLYLPDRLAASWSLSPGDVVEVVSSRPTLTPLGPQPRVRRLPLAGTFAAGRTEGEERVALPLATARQLLAGGAGRVLVSAGGLAAAEELAPRLAGALPEGSVVRSWRELERPLFFALRLEKSVMFVAVSLIVAVAALALVADLGLIIANKRREIGMLGTLGATRGELRLAFVLLGGSLAALGGGAGATIGLLVAKGLDRYRVLTLPEQVYFLDHVPFEVRGADLAAVLAVTGVLSLLSAAWAAGRAAGLDPVEALRR